MSRQSETAALRLAAFRRILLWACALASASMPCGCTPAGIPSAREEALLKEVESRGLIVGFEGLQPFSGFRIQELTQAVGDDCGLAHCSTSGNCMIHMPIIEQAHKHGQPIYLVGYSLGGDQARLLAQECQKRGIPIRILFLLDPRYMAARTPAKVPANVRRAVFYTSSSYDDSIAVPPTTAHLADPAGTALLAEDLTSADHMDLPAAVTSRIRTEVDVDLRIITPR